ncbi:MAG: ATP-binding cassette domain-containing protein [Thermoplasmata archaeon]
MIELKNITLRMKSFSLQNIDLKINENEYFVLLGPTGSGKSMIMDIIAGSIIPDEGRIIINGRDITYLPPEKRNVGYVTQDYSLFDHMKVIDNITFGLRVRKVSEKDAMNIIKPLVDKFNLNDLLDKYPYVLSGGEKQKVAIVRALAINPDILLLDEPLVSLDPNIRSRFMVELKNIHEEMKFTTLHVTHSIDEAEYLADHLGIIKSGRIIQVGKFDEISRNPSSDFVASFIGLENIISDDEINKILNVDKGKRIAFRPVDVEISDNGIEMDIEGMQKLYSGIRIMGKVNNSKITVILNSVSEIKNGKIKIKIKRFSVIQD